MDSVFVSSGVGTFFIGGSALLAIGFGIYNALWVFSSKIIKDIGHWNRYKECKIE